MTQRPRQRVEEFSRDLERELNTIVVQYILRKLHAIWQALFGRKKDA